MTILLLSGCEEDIHDKSKKVLEFFKDHKGGMNGDFGIFKSNSIIQSEPVVVVFGFYDKSKECQEIADRYNQQEPGVYMCRALNN